MALTTTVGNAILDSIVSSYDTLYLLKTSGATIDVAVSTYGGIVVDNAKTLSWASASGGTSVSTSNSATSNPLNYSVPANSALTQLILVDSGNVVRGIISLVTPPTYTGGDGPYFVRDIELTLSEV